MRAERGFTMTDDRRSSMPADGPTPAGGGARPRTVGVLGTGRMGAGMARSLARAGFDLLVYNRTLDRAATLAEEIGARQCATPAEVAESADVTISMVSDGAAVEQLYRAPQGLLDGVHPGMVVVDMSTVLPSTILGLETAIRALGAGVLDAPVSGSVALAESGGLTVMAGGTDEDFERVKPVFEGVARTVFHIGPLGSGAAMKLAVNTIIIGLNQALAEGLVLAERSGIDPAVAYDVFATSAVGAPFVGYKRNAFLKPDETPAAFSIELAAKDLSLIRAHAEAVELSLPQARTNLAELHSAAGTHGADADFSAVASHLRKGGATR